MMTTLTPLTPSDGTGFLEIVIQGVKIRLVFASEWNAEAPALVREILKNSYLRRQSA